MTDIVIVGGGPGGAAAAITLARAGREVVVLEREPRPSHKVCGEFLSTEAVAFFASWGLSPPGLGAVPLRKVRVSSGRHVSQAPLPFAAWSLTRRTLDDALLQLASKAGASVLRGASCEGLRSCGSSWEITLRDQGMIEARHVFLATGKHDLRGFARPRGKQNDLTAFKLYYRLRSDQWAALGDAVELHLFPGGYAGLQRVEGGLANLCCVVQSELLAGGPDRWQHLLDRMSAGSHLLAERLQDASAELARPLALSSIPYGLVREDAADGLWRLGDQASVIPSFTGDGMSMALWNGQRAARMLLEGASPEAFQRSTAAGVRGQVGFATLLSRCMVHAQAQALATPLLQLCPSVLGWIAARTRLRSV